MLDRIVAEKKEEVAQRKKSVPISALKERIIRQKAPLDLASALMGDGIRLIAEIKRASPSCGVLCPNFDPVALAKDYAENGAAAISVLTEENYFQGSLEHLTVVRERVNLPLVRKDFVLDPYQVYESRAFGADALLLITAILSQAQLEELLLLSHELGMSCLVEVHNEDEVERALKCKAQIIGINNRDLNTFKVDIETTRRLCSLIPEGKIVVSESGISRRGDIEKLKGWGVKVVLVGEALVTASDIPARMRDLLL